MCQYNTNHCIVPLCTTANQRHTATILSMISNVPHSKSIHESEIVCQKTMVRYTWLEEGRQSKAMYPDSSQIIAQHHLDGIPLPDCC